MNRPKFHLKVMSMVMLITFCNTLFFPTASMALTSGPVQAEYIGYESGATDMVQLLTGDLAYSLPIMNVPSPEGGFSFPLSYSSGIQPNQQASWVGLGWTLNVGAITRSVSMFPDDSKGNVSTNTFKDPGQSGLTSKTPGGILKISYDYSQPNKGMGGIVNLGIMKVGFGSSQGFTGFGVTYKKGEKPHYDATEIGINVAAIALTAAFPPAGVGSWAALGVSLATDAITALVIENIVNGLHGMAYPYNGNYNLGNWGMNKWTTPWKLDTKCSAAVIALLGPIKGPIVSALLCMRKEYHWDLNLDRTNSEKMYGSLYLSDQPSGSSGLSKETALKIDNGSSRTAIPTYTHSASSDMYMNLTADQLGENDQPSHIAYDNYQVMGQNVTGSISPYRHDLGFLALPYSMGTNIENFAAKAFTQSKVHFNYIGDMANEYRYHAKGTDLKNPISGITFNSKVSVQRAVEYDSDIQITGSMEGEGQRVGNTRDVGALNHSDDHLGGSKNVRWYSNKEIKDGDAEADGFVDIHPAGTTRANFRDSLPQDGIGGYSVTASDGTTYHYALPVYVQKEITYTGNADESSYSKRTTTVPHAVTWLLTAITGSDFYDRGGASNAANGIIDEADWGRWVKMDYGKFAEAYSYRTPYHNKEKQYGPSGESKGNTYNYGEREVYYLDRIQTRSHTALFVKNLRTDAKGHYYTDPGGTSGTKPTSALKLEEIVLLTNDDYNDFVTTESFGVNSGGQAGAYAQLQNGETIDQVIDLGDIDDLSGATSLTSERAFLNTHQIQKVVFNHTNDLCQGTLNSFDFVSGNPPWSTTVNYTGKGGKLTLNSIATYGRNNVKLSPDYDFEYASGSKNPTYDVHKWDQWGMYWKHGATGYLGHNNQDFLPPETNNEEDYWHLKKIVTPTGSEIKIDYERDDYSQISGFFVAAKKLGGDVRVKQIAVSDAFEGKVTENRTVYQYHRFDQSTVSSGVVSMEPPWSRTLDFAFYHWFDYPTTPVMYQNVAVLQGVKADGSYLSKKQYEFEVPHHDKYVKAHQYTYGPTSKNLYSRHTMFNLKHRTYEYVEKASHHKLYSNLWSIGRMNSVKEYNNQDHLLSSITYNYIDGDNYEENKGTPGLRTYGSFTGYKVDDQQKNPATNDKERTYYYNISRTTKVFYPNILSSMEIEDQGVSYEIKNTQYDFNSGMVLERQYENSLGYSYKTKMIPAHFYHSSMRDGVLAKSTIDPSHAKHMLTEPGAEYLQVLHNGKWKYIKAVGNLWGGGTTYWGSGNNDAIRPAVKYVWNDEIERNGTYATDPTNFDVSVLWNPFQWEMQEASTGYDNYSFPTEHRGIHTFSSSRKDNNGVYVIASANNAKYSEFTFSDAEQDVNSASEYNGGLKADGTASRREAALEDGSTASGFQAMEAHTGDYVYKVPTGSSLYFETTIGTTANVIPPNKVYRLSFWQHDVSFGNVPNIKTEIFGGTATGSGEHITYPGTASLNIINQTANSVNCTSTQFGDWHLVEMDITVTVPANKGAKTLKVELENTGTGTDPIYIDDFRFLPLDATMEASVLDYESGTGRVRAQLNNQNVGTKYTYYSTIPYKVDRVKEVYKEEIDDVGTTHTGGFKKVLEKDYNIVK